LVGLHHSKAEAAKEMKPWLCARVHWHLRADAHQGDPPLRHSTQNDNCQYTPDRIGRISIHTEDA
jgi:hypothetical protein